MPNILTPELILSYCAYFVLAAIVAYLAAFPLRRLALRLGIVDHPEKRKIHQIPVPLMGGVVLFTAFVAVSGLALFRGDIPPTSYRSFVGLLAGGALVLILGIYDDIRGLSPLAKFGGQTAAALVVVAMGARVEGFTNPVGGTFELGWLGVPLAVLWIVGATNAVNLIDGLDGLAAGIGTIAALGMFAVAAPERAYVATLAVIVAGAGLGFLRHNFYPARMFLGDSGSMLIGFSLAVIGIFGSLKATTATVLFLPIIVLGVPLFDTLFAILRRAKMRVSPFKADREHIHHRLVRIGLHHRNVVLVIYFVCAYLALTAYSIAHIPYQSGLLFLILLTMGGIIGLKTLNFVEERLETALSKTQAAAAGEPRGGGNGGARIGKPNGSGWRDGEFTTLLCEVSGFAQAAQSPGEVQALCEGIHSMVSRRIKTYSVVAEPSAPGRMLLIVRTRPLDADLEGLVKESLARYLEDEKDRLSEAQAFPAIRWLDPGGGGGSAPEATGPGSEKLAAKDRLALSS